MIPLIEGSVDRTPAVLLSHPTQPIFSATAIHRNVARHQETHFQGLGRSWELSVPQWSSQPNILSDRPETLGTGHDTLS
ncbi:hypothetical protein TIFTF001_024534 [Ficus carica]|uniref:Uncharacterized protein n=1 Tax=Ficus carica TaxID=3494 RepID=A0AA88AM80_FICCA|nr:hypothetical protein TIFTF001_024534 [Ficus carica]